MGSGLFCGLAFHFFDGFLLSTEFFNSDEVQFICFYFDVISKKVYQAQHYKDLLLFYSKCFIVLLLIFRSILS